MPPAMSDPWSDALRVAHLAAADPHGCGGILVRAGAGPVRDAWLAVLRGLIGEDTPVRRMPAGIADDRLIGGLDLAATLRTGRPVAQRGLLAETDGGFLVVPMAERLPPGTAARLAAALDSGVVLVERDGLQQRLPARFGLILLDEGIDDEAAPAVLAERLAFRVDLTDVALRDAKNAASAERRGRCVEPHHVGMDDDSVAALCEAAAALGVLSLRGPLLAARVARIAAALDGRNAVAEADAIEAARLVLAPRATRIPASDAPPEQPTDLDETGTEPESPAEAAAPESSPDAEEGGPPSLDEQVIAAARAAIPPGLLALLSGGGPRLRAPKAGRVGASAAASRSGRPIGARPGDPRHGRLNLIETLRAAAPWQRIRGAAPGRVIVRPEDVRITRFRQRTETTTIFAVDASGSAALERLAEAKGAVELLLAEAYTRRDRVALVAFRGQGADVILPPTRSLVRAKRGLAALPGGGGTPLAGGIEAATNLALGVRRGGGTPVVVLLTDGRANVARSGEGGRARALEDALGAARAFRALGVRAILIDTAPRPQEPARRLAAAMEARYLALPHADSGAMSAAVRAVIDRGPA
ncbi:magnesium chelatase subunit D [Methylobacterium iners]|uniref:Magnesium-chelatase 60 kDa subunit n=1 Tax=Methylobacterium iners TaxID=418707 RepID=A0ABQ4RXB1_9HYPH|nr:Magnesium-chelatase 60 kDa subunit [Methylobacterium iners]